MILKPEQLTAFLDAVKDQKYKTLFMLAVFSGARQGELLGLKWSDLDYQKQPNSHPADVQPPNLLRYQNRNIDPQG